MRTLGFGIVITLSFTTALLLTACDGASFGAGADLVQRTFQVTPGGNLVLDSNSGSIEIAAGTADVVGVKVEREGSGMSNQDALKQLDLDFRQDGNSVYVRARQPQHFFNWGSRLRLRFVVTVPSKFNVDLKTGGGGISVNDLEGTILARTSGGSLKFGRIVGSVNGHTSGGGITLDGGVGPMEVVTSGGSIRIGRVDGNVKARTSGGSISADEVQGAMEASTSGGSVAATLSKQPDRDCDLRTSGGSIHVRLSRDLSLNLVADTSGGHVRTTLPVTLQGEISSKRLEAKLNNGGPQLRLHTSGGSISIDSIQ